MAPPAQAKSRPWFLDHAGGRLLDLPEKEKKGGKRGKRRRKRRGRRLLQYEKHFAGLIRLRELQQEEQMV